MAKLNVSIQDKRRPAAEVVNRLRRQSATLSGKEIVDVVRRDLKRAD